MTESEGMTPRVNALINTLSGSEPEQDVVASEQVAATDVAGAVKEAVAIDMPVAVSDDEDDLPGTAVKTVVSAVKEEASNVETEPKTTIDSLFRDEETPATENLTTNKDQTEKTAVIEVVDPDREAAREARAKRLGIVSAAPPVAEQVVVAPKVKRTTDKWHGSLGLFLLRFATAALLFVQGYSRLMHWTATKEFFSHSVLPNSTYFAIAVIAAELLAALLLVFGFMTRFAGVLLVSVEVIFLAFFIYGKSGAIYTPGEAGFRGDIEILMAAIGLLFLLLGGGGFAMDRIFRRKRAIRKEQKLLGNTV